MQSSTTPDPGHHMGKLQKYRKHHIQESQEVSPFPEGDHKAATNRQDSLTVQNITIKKGSTVNLNKWGI